MIGLIGLSHKSAPLHIRERFSLDERESSLLAKAITADRHIDETVILSTCNRTEIYFKAHDCCASGAFSIVGKYLLKQTNTEEFQESYFYQLRNDEVIVHLFRVVSSLESMILGEYQIVAQVKEAYRLAEKNQTTGKIFNRLFIKAFETGKLVRSATTMSNGVFSVSSAAVEKCQEQFGDLYNKKVLLIGAGETGELVLKTLHKKGCSSITITNRTIGRAEKLANEYGGTVLPFERYMQGIHDAEIIVSSVTGKEPLFDAHQVAHHLNGHPKVMIIDLGVPRNINPNVAEIPGITLLNVDDLKEAVTNNLMKKQESVSGAEAIIAEKTTEFVDWLCVQNLSPAIQNIVSSVTSINDGELAALKKFASDDEYRQLEKFGKQVSEKMINSLIKTLKVISNNGRKPECVKVVNDLFGPLPE